MADAKTNTLNHEVDLDALEAASIRADYAHSLAVLITEQRDFSQFSLQQRTALFALVNFTSDVKNAISELIR